MVPQWIKRFSTAGGMVPLLAVPASECGVLPGAFSSSNRDRDWILADSAGPSIAARFESNRQMRIVNCAAA